MTLPLALFLAPNAMLTVPSDSPIDFLHFRLMLPIGYSLRPVDRPMMDFYLYELVAPNRRVIAKIYAGNCPDFTFDSAKHVRHFIAHHLAIVETKPGSPPGDLLIEYNQRESRRPSAFSRLHLFGFSGSNSQREIVAKAFSQISIVRPVLD